MLANVLALAVALGSLAIYLTAFFFPEIHRKSDFIWSGVGLFYALVLWVCSARITGGVLLGQTASIALLGWFGWQTLTLRYSLTPPAQRTELPGTEQIQDKLGGASSGQLQERVSGLLTNAKDQIQNTLSRFTKGKNKPEAATSQKPATSAATVESAASGTTATKGPRVDVVVVEAEPVETVVAPERQVQPPPSESQTVEAELVRPNPPDAEIVEAAVEDAEAKHLPSHPPEVADTDHNSAKANQPLENPPNPT